MSVEAIKTVETNKVETKALTIVEQAKTVRVFDSETYTNAGEVWKTIRNMLKEISDTFDPIITAAHLSHKKALEQKAKFHKPLEEAQRNIKRLMSAYDEEQEKIRKAEEARLAEIARKEEEARRMEALRIIEEERKAEENRLFEAALAAEKNGDKDQSEKIMELAEERSREASQEAAQIQAEPIFVPPTIIPKSTPKLSGGPVYREVWSAEVIDIKALCRAVAEGKASPECVLGNMPVLNKLATGLKNTMNIAGVRAVSRRV